MEKQQTSDKLRRSAQQLGKNLHNSTIRHTATFVPTAVRKSNHMQE
jgi:hypothetical protein